MEEVVLPNACAHSELQELTLILGRKSYSQMKKWRPYRNSQPSSRSNSLAYAHLYEYYYPCLVCPRDNNIHLFFTTHGREVWQLLPQHFYASGNPSSLYAQSEGRLASGDIGAVERQIWSIRLCILHECVREVLSRTRSTSDSYPRCLVGWVGWPPKDFWFYLQSSVTESRLPPPCLSLFSSSTDFHQFYLCMTRASRGVIFTYSSGSGRLNNPSRSASLVIHT